MTEIERLRAALTDRYRIERALGAGGMATVYLAEDLKHHRQVAVKVLKPELAAVLGADRFLREIEITARLQHPRIITLIDSGESDGILYYVLPYVAGESLKDKLDRETQLAIEVALEIAIAIGSALDYAHRHGVVHRDIKPGNILMSEGEPMIADFGIALAVNVAGRGRITESGLSLGTPDYMSPEQALGDPNVDARTDVYSLGCVLYEMLAGEPPYTGATAQAVVSKLVNAPVPSVRSVRTNVPEHVDGALHRALAKVPADRFGSAGAFVESLSGARAPITAPTPRVPARRPRVALLGAMVVVAIGAIALWTLRPSSPRYGGIGPGGRVSLLLSTESAVDDAALSRDGGQIVYVGRAGRQRDLFVRRVAGGQALRLTNDSTAEGWPTFSPDGEWIAFSRRDRGVWLIPAFGGNASSVVGRGRFPAWSPDGERLALVQRQAGGPDLLATVRRDGSDLRVVFRNSPPYSLLRRPAWSPDGATLAVVRSMGGVSGEIWLVSLDGGATRLIDDPPGVHSDFPAYTPDGRGVVHSSNRGGSRNLWIAPVGGGDLERLTTGSGPDASPTVAQDGTIAFLNSRWRSELYVHDFGTGEQRALRQHAAALWAPAFSPSGDAIAISQLETDGAWHIWTVPLSGEPARQVTTGSPPQIYPQFTPDGEGLTYHSWSDTGRIWRVPLAGGPAIPLTPPGAAYAEVSPDGRHVAYVRSNGVERIYIAPLEGGPARLLTESPGSVPRWSPDGNRLVFSRDRDYAGGIFIINADGSDERRLTERGGWPVWWPDGSRVAYRIIGVDGAQQIHVVAAAGGPSRHLDEFRFSGANTPFAVSPDGGRLGTVRGVHLADEIWLIRPAP